MKTVALVTALAAGGCAQFRPPPASSEKAQEAVSCTKEAVIEDGEDGDDRIVVLGGRGGYLYSFDDEKGTTVEPKGDNVTAQPGGASGSSFALHFTGKLGDGANGDDAFAGIGFSFTEPKAVYDATRWKGVSFVARRSAGSVQAMRLSMPDANTDPDGKACTDCYNDFGITFKIDEAWTRYQVAFADLKQEPDWGAPRPPNVEVAKLFGVQWQVMGRNSPFDVWVDDVRFLGCPTDGQEK